MSPAPIGHNSAVVKKDLEGLVKRVEDLLAERKAVTDDIKEVMDEAKAKGFSVPKIREMLKLRAMDTEKRKESEELRDLYIAALDLI